MRVFDCVNEANESYINACFRSSIICSSNAVEQTLMHRVIFNSDDWERKYWEIVIKKWTFKDVLDEIRRSRNKTLTKFIKDADWLREVRNIIVAHPSYITDFEELKGRDQIIWANKMIIKELSRLLQFFNSEERKKFLQTPLTTKTRDGKTIRESETLEQFLSQPAKIEKAEIFNWWAFEKGLLSQFSLKAYKKMSKIINEIHGKDTLKGKKGRLIHSKKRGLG